MSTQWPTRVVIENVRPQINGGRFPIKRAVGERVVVTANIYADSHDALAAVVRYKPAKQVTWQEASMELAERGLDLWRGSFLVTTLEPYEYSVETWIDHFQSWRRGLTKKIEAGQDVSVALLMGARLIEEASQRAPGTDAKKLAEWTRMLGSQGTDSRGRIQYVLDDELVALMERYPDRRHSTTYDKQLGVVVDREKVRFSAWYEMFPCSCASEAGRHGTFKDYEKRLPYVASMGFDVLYLIPIHPIGCTHRKGRNNSLIARPDDVRAPWAIGAQEEGYKTIHPQLGTFEDFQRLIAKAREYGIEIALDIAFQCSPDHPYVKEHPEWLRQRPDGTVQYAENPPKKYEDIYPLNFETEAWRKLWEELKSVVLFWIDQGIRIFRVDNPHTKPFPFWEWLISKVKKDYPEVLFLSEAFARPQEVPGAISTRGATPRRSIKTLESSSRTSNPPTGVGIPWPMPIIGIVSIPTSQTSTMTIRRCARLSSKRWISGWGWALTGSGWTPFPTYTSERARTVRTCLRLTKP